MGSSISSNVPVISIPRRRSEVFKPKATSLNGKPRELTKSDCEYLKRSWTIIAPDNLQQFELLYEFGIEVYEEIFSLAPEMTKFFPTIHAGLKKSSSMVELREIAAFRNQALRLVDVLAYSVQSCETITTLESRFRDIGRRHQMYVKTELTRDHFRVIEQATLIVVHARLEQHRINNNEAKLDDDTIHKMLKAWSALLGYMIYQIRAGYTGDAK